MAEQEKITLHYTEFPCINATGGTLISCGEKSVKTDVHAIYVVDDSCTGTEGFETILRGFHHIRIEDNNGEIYKEDRHHGQFILMKKDFECILIWYPDTEARGSSFSDAMKNAEQVALLKKLRI